MSSYIHAVAAKALLIDARINSMTCSIVSITSASERDRRMDLCCKVGRELEPVTLQIARFPEMHPMIDKNSGVISTSAHITYRDSCPNFPGHDL